MDTALKTPQTHPDHQVIGRLFVGHGRIYYCDSYDPRLGFWMTNVMDASDRRNISERAPHRTFHPIHGVWTPAELREGLEYHLVDLRTSPFSPRRVSFEEASAAQWWQPLFHEDYQANTAARRATAAQEQMTARLS